MTLLALEKISLKSFIFPCHSASETLWTIFAAFIGVTCFVLIVAVHGYRSWRTWRKIFQDVLTHGRAASRIQLRDGGFVRF